MRRREVGLRRRSRASWFGRLGLLFLCLPASGAAIASGMHPEHGPHAMVATVHALASQAGSEILQTGGNAVDAAVAVGFTLAVVHPQAGNIGGGGFMLIRLKNGATHFLDFRETAPAAASATMYQDAQGQVVADRSVIGYLAAGVPGSVKGLAFAEQHFGRLQLAQVMAPAIRIAREGYRLSWGDARLLNEEAALGKFADSRRIFQNGGKGWHRGDLFRQPELARTLERIAVDPEEFYHGRMAQQIADLVHEGGGIITRADLASYTVKDRQPVRGTYRGLEIISAPPPSSGGTALIEALNILEGFDLAQAGLDSAHAIHLIVEAYRRAFFDRAQFMGDPDFTPIPVAELTDKRYAAEWRASIAPSRATPSSELRRPTTFPQLSRYAAEHPIFAPRRQSQHTTHYSIVDADGNAVAVTTTLNDDFGSRVTLGPLGFLLNDEMDDFAAKVGVPNLYGLIQGEANAVGPNKRPLSAMTPTMVLKGGKLWLVLGSPGGPTIITTVANILIAAADDALDIQAAVNAPRFHHQWLPDRIQMERERFSPDTLRQLTAAGYQIDWTGQMGDAECIQIDPVSSERLGASDGRNESGKAVGY